MVSSTSIGQGQADIADGDETAFVGVDVLQIAVEHQELHPSPQRPVAVVGGDERERRREERTAREVAKGLVVPVDRVVVAEAEPGAKPMPM